MTIMPKYVDVDLYDLIDFGIFLVSKMDAELSEFFIDLFPEKVSESDFLGFLVEKPLIHENTRSKIEENMDILRYFLEKSGKWAL